MTLAIDATYVGLGLIAAPLSLLRGRWSRTADHLRRRALTAPPTRSGDRRCLWLHAVSVGEIMTVRRLVARLADAFDDLDIVISSSTRAGVETAQKHFEGCEVFSCPLDLSPLVRRALDRVRPDAIVIVEHDLWPNFVRLARGRGVPVALINARLSPGSLAGYRRLSRLYPWPPRDLQALCVQDEISADAFAELGFDRERLVVCGNLKFDNPPSPASDLRAQMGFASDDWLLVAGSTHEGEEDVILDAFERIRAEDPRTWLVLVPRRVERAAEIVAAVEARGLSCRRWTESKTKGPDVLLVDTVGELAKLSAAGDVVFVGGSLAPIGGHNVIEPASYARPVVIGPRYHNFTSIVETFRRAEAIVIGRDGDDVIERLLELKRDPAAARALGERGKRCVDENAGAGERTLDVLRGVLHRADC